MMADHNHLLSKEDQALSDAYLRIRALLNAWDTAPGGADRFEVTEQRLTELLARAAKITCPACGTVVEQVASATLDLALWQHWHWVCPKRPR